MNGIAVTDPDVRPNQFARPAWLEPDGEFVSIHGYQDFLLSPNAIRVLPIDGNLQAKRDLLAPLFQPSVLGRRRVLDLGANGGFFCFWALQRGAAQAIAVDLDEDYVKIVEGARQAIGETRLRAVCENVVNWNEPADVVLALAIVHWVYSCTAAFGSLDEAVKKLAELAGYMLIVEWIAPEDSAIAFYGHLDKNSECHREPYTLAEFESALAKHFCRFESIGSISATRRIYVAYKTAEPIDLSGPWPKIGETEETLTRRRLATLHGVDYWSHVARDGNVIVKEATLDLAAREVDFLKRLDSSYFPRVVEATHADGTSRLVLRKVEGVRIGEARDRINETPERFADFFRHCLCILAELKDAGIQHRDIRPANVLVTPDGRPVLLDFGWSISAEHPFATPAGLGELGRPPDGSFCDVYSMGVLLQSVAENRQPKFEPILSLMAETDPARRIADPAVLMEMVDAVQGETSPAMTQLLETVSRANQMCRWLERQVDETKTKLAKQESATETAMAWVAREKNAAAARVNAPKPVEPPPKLQPVQPAVDFRVPRPKPTLAVEPGPIAIPAVSEPAPSEDSFRVLAAKMKAKIVRRVRTHLKAVPGLRSAVLFGRRLRGAA